MLSFVFNKTFSRLACNHLYPSFQLQNHSLKSVLTWYFKTLEFFLSTYVSIKLLNSMLSLWLMLNQLVSNFFSFQSLIEIREFLLQLSDFFVSACLLRVWLFPEGSHANNPETRFYISLISWCRIKHLLFPFNSNYVYLKSLLAMAKCLKVKPHDKLDKINRNILWR